ncbi:hypothetical protein L798_12445 [Zootermopsis nevadensis]|uniref:Uncharacterized protein n=1 Tax=Zootermopsis nevadensis TaxID=136037 RepID=A0A067R5T0_ZOONE|nr:hypothetical protein L798_12445 [Zootermopsis nevadensis]
MQVCLVAKQHSVEMPNGDELEPLYDVVRQSPKPNLEDQSPKFISPRARWTGCTPRHQIAWVPQEHHLPNPLFEPLRENFYGVSLQSIQSQEFLPVFQ